MAIQQWKGGDMIAWLLIAASAPAAICPPIRQGRPLQAVTLYDGPVSDNAILAPDSSRTTGGVLAQQWTVADIYRQGRALTVRCRYRGAGEVEAKPPGPVAVCRARWSKAAASFDCR